MHTFTILYRNYDWSKSEVGIFRQGVTQGQLIRSFRQMLLKVSCV